MMEVGNENTWFTECLRINKGRIMMVPFIILVIHTNAFLKNKFNSLFIDTFAEMN